MSFAKKSLTGLLATIPMALIVHIGSAAAASPITDRNEELRTLLSGRPTVAATTASAPRRVEKTRSIGDAQQQARDVVLAISPRTAPPSRSYAAKPNRERTHADAQTQAQEVILGRIGAPKAGA